MDKRFIKQIDHQPVKPVEIERLPGDWIFIEGVRFSADYFREFAHPDTDVLYAVKRDGDQVWLTVIRNVDEAVKFFEEIQNAL